MRSTIVATGSVNGTTDRKQCASLAGRSIDRFRSGRGSSSCWISTRLKSFVPIAVRDGKVVLALQHWTY